MEIHQKLIINLQGLQIKKYERLYKTTDTTRKPSFSFHFFAWATCGRYSRRPN